MGRTLVTGSTGLVGHNIVQALLADSREVVAMVRSLDKGRRLLPDAVTLRQGDVTDPAAIRAAMDGCDVVYHAAGHPEQWLRDEGIFERVNVGGTRHMVEAALDLSVKRFVYTSTIDVFAAARGEPYDESEIDAADKGTVYERSKQAADRLVATAVEKDELPAVFVHPAAVYGPGPAASPGINDLVERLRDGKVPGLLPGGMPVVYAPDVGRGHVLAEGAEVGDRFILTERYVELVDLAQVIVEALGSGKVPRVLPLWLVKIVSAAGAQLSRLTGRPPLVPAGQLHFLQWGARPSSQHARDRLGWHTVPLPEGIAHTVAYLQARPEP
jgi:dihydroflavonol-4-reductase